MSRIPALVAFAVAFLPTAFAGFNPSASNNLALYWGQNSAGVFQQRLSHVCEKSEVDIIPISFLTSLRHPSLDLASASENCTIIPGSKLLYCPQVGQDIRECQNKYNKTILLSLGGATYTEGGFKNQKVALAAARNLWDSFGPLRSRFHAPRPFGSAIIDGFDLDFEHSVANMPAFANELRRLMDQSAHRPGIRKYLLTAAPQCVYPDAANYEMLNGVVPFDAVFVQFYNNYCGLQSFQRSSTEQQSFNFQVWDKWARTVSRNPDVKVLLGIPASWSAAASGYTNGKELRQIIAYSREFQTFGGVMMWDASQIDANEGFLESVADSLSILPFQNAPGSQGKPAPSIPKVSYEKVDPASLKDAFGKPAPALGKAQDLTNKHHQLSTTRAHPNIANAVLDRVNIAAPTKTPAH